MMGNKLKWSTFILSLGLLCLVQPFTVSATTYDYQSGYYAGRHDEQRCPENISRYRAFNVYPGYGHYNIRDWDTGYLAGLRSHIGEDNIIYQTRQLQMQTRYLTEFSPAIRPHRPLIMQPFRPGVQPIPIHSYYNNRRPVVRPLERPTHPGPQPFCPYIRR